MRATSLLLFSLLSIGCSSEKGFAGEEQADTAPPSGADPDVSDDTAVTDTGIFVEPAWWRLSAHLLLAEGVPVPGNSTVTVELLSEDDTLLCEQELPLASAEPGEAADPILGWWSLTPEPIKTLCGVYTSPMSTVISVGIGALHQDVEAAIGGVEGIDPDAPLNGAYMADVAEPERVYAYGVAGTAAAFEGEGEVAVEAPLQDGSWRIEPVYRFSY